MNDRERLEELEARAQYQELKDRAEENSTDMGDSDWVALPEQGIPSKPATNRGILEPILGPVFSAVNGATRAATLGYGNDLDPELAKDYPRSDTVGEVGGHIGTNLALAGLLGAAAPAANIGVKMGINALGFGTKGFVQKPKGEDTVSARLENGGIDAALGAAGPLVPLIPKASTTLPGRLVTGSAMGAAAQGLRTPQEGETRLDNALNGAASGLGMGLGIEGGLGAAQVASKLPQWLGGKLAKLTPKQAELYSQDAPQIEALYEKYSKDPIALTEQIRKWVKQKIGTGEGSIFQAHTKKAIEKRNTLLSSKEISVSPGDFQGTAAHDEIMRAHRTANPTQKVTIPASADKSVVVNPNMASRTASTGIELEPVVKQEPYVVERFVRSPAPEPKPQGAHAQLPGQIAEQGHKPIDGPGFPPKYTESASTTAGTQRSFGEALGEHLDQKKPVGFNKALDSIDPNAPSVMPQGGEPARVTLDGPKVTSKIRPNTPQQSFEIPSQTPDRVTITGTQAERARSMADEAAMHKATLNPLGVTVKDPKEVAAAHRLRKAMRAQDPRIGKLNSEIGKDVRYNEYAEDALSTDPLKLLEAGTEGANTMRATRQHLDQRGDLNLGSLAAGLETGKAVNKVPDGAWDRVINQPLGKGILRHFGDIPNPGEINGSLLQMLYQLEKSKRGSHGTDSSN